MGVVGFGVSFGALSEIRNTNSIASSRWVRLALFVATKEVNDDDDNGWMEDEKWKFGDTSYTLPLPHL